MTDEQTNEQPVKNRRIRWANIGIFFSTLGTLIFIGAFAWGYFQLSKVNIEFAQTVASLQQQAADNQSQLSTLQQSISSMQDTLKKSEDLTSQQEKIMADWRAMQQVDVTPVYLQLNTLNHDIDQLTLLHLPIANTEAVNATTVIEDKTSWWKSAWHYFVQALKKVVVVHNMADTNLPLVSPESKLFLYQNLHAQLEQAMWAVLHHNPDVYHASLTRASAWVTQYFVQDASETKAVLSRIEELQKANVLPSKEAEQVKPVQ